MLNVLVAMLAPTVGFGLFALLCMRFGAETRPYFDEQPVHDERPNWFPIAGAGAGRSDDGDGDEPGGEPDPVPVPAPAARRQPRRVSPASASSAATSPSGV